MDNVNQSIELQEPFKSLYRKGYLQKHKNNRRYVCLYNHNGRRSIISYARYLMSVKIGALISSAYEVDHIDNDFTNDDINNLQILTCKENLAKQHLYYKEFIQIRKEFICPECSKSFILTEREIKQKEKNSKHNFKFCSNLCSRKYFPLPVRVLTEEDKALIKLYRSKGFSGYKIADITGFSRETIYKYSN